MKYQFMWKELKNFHLEVEILLDIMNIDGVLFDLNVIVHRFVRIKERLRILYI